MALKVYDGLDHYNAQADLLNRSGFLQWQLINTGFNPGSLTFVPGPYNLGKALKVKNVDLNPTTAPAAGARAVWGDRNDEAFVSQRILIPDAVAGFACQLAVVLFDGVANAPQLTIFFNGTNYSIQVYRGGFVGYGTLIATSSNNVWTPDVWEFYEIHPVIANSTGSIDIRKQGVSVFGGPVTGLDTQATANAWFDTADYYPLCLFSSLGSFVYVDDVRYNDTVAGPGPNPYDSYMGDMRCVTSFVFGNDTVQFTPAITSSSIGSTTTGSTVSNAPNNISFAPFSSPFSGVMAAALTVNLNAAVVGHVVLGLYDSDGLDGAPGTKLAQSAAVTNPVLGNNTFTLGSTPLMETNHTYYWAFSSDATATVRSAAGSNTWYTVNSAYSGTMPANVTSSAIPVTFSNGVAAVSGTLTLSNDGNVSEVAMDSDTTYNHTATLNDEDLFNFQALPLLIDMIAAVQLTISVRKDEAGTRSVATSLKVGVTEVHSTNHTLGLSYQYFTDLWELNPDTSMPWDAVSVNGLSGGYKVTV